MKLVKAWLDRIQAGTIKRHRRPSPHPPQDFASSAAGRHHVGIGREAGFSCDGQFVAFLDLLAAYGDRDDDTADDAERTQILEPVEPHWPPKAAGWFS